ncbi:hypothetical protein C8R46DRAFT_1077319 [Mycena filopes]|nr:hypothetical protein C8R46DRAFT_1077319 [Mycena filopes]
MLPAYHVVVHKPTVVEMPAEFHDFESFKYRLWFTWYALTSKPTGIASSMAWASVIFNPEEDFWLWEEEDEDTIKMFVDNLLPGVVISEIPPEEWREACLALEMCLSTPRTADHLAHLPSKTRVAFVAWLLVAGPRRRRLRWEGRLEAILGSIIRWAKLLGIREQASPCHKCVPQFVPGWADVMLSVYHFNDLWALPWRDCCCLRTYLSAKRDLQPPFELDIRSPILHLLHELVVPSWLLICWIAFRTVVNHANVPAFLANLSGPDGDLFTWDNDNDSKLFNTLLKGDTYPQIWTQHLVEIDLLTWSEIRDYTWDAHRPSLGPEDLAIRLTACGLKFSSSTATNGLTAIMAPLEAVKIAYHEESFDSLIALDPVPPTPGDFKSGEFWAADRLEAWIRVRNEDLIRTIWFRSNLTILARAQYVARVLRRSPTLDNLAIYTYTYISQRSDDGRDRALESFWDFIIPATTRADVLTEYSSQLSTLLNLLKESFDVSSGLNSSRISMDIHNAINDDISIMVANLVVFLHDRVDYNGIVGLQGEQAQDFLNLLQDLLDIELFSVIHPKLLTLLIRLSGKTNLHPLCLPVPHLYIHDRRIIAAGGFGEIYRGTLHGEDVSVKVMKIYANQDIQLALKAVGREAMLWRQFNHPNVLPFFGVHKMPDGSDRLCLISPWMKNGNITDFLKANTDLPSINRVTLMFDVALGLEYLHREQIVHGDLKPENILVTASYRACIADFGLSSISHKLSSVQFTHTTITPHGGTIRYQAIELILPPASPELPHYGSDIYAFACVCYVILTGKVPFFDTAPNDASIILLLYAGGAQPTRLDSCSGTAQLDALWALLERCWDDKSSRTDAPGVVAALSSPPISAAPPPFGAVEWDEEATSRFRCSLQPKPLLPSEIWIENFLLADPPH